MCSKCGRPLTDKILILNILRSNPKTWFSIKDLFEKSHIGILTLERRMYELRLEGRIIYDYVKIKDGGGPPNIYYRFKK